MLPQTRNCRSVCRVDFSLPINKFGGLKSILLYNGVDEVTILEPDDKNNLPYKTNAVNLIRLLDDYTEDYFNMKIALEKCA